MDREQITAEITDIVKEIIEMDEFDPDANFSEDLEVDSLLALEILATIEKKYKIEVPEERIAEVTTLNETIDLVLDVIKESKMQA